MIIATKNGDEICELKFDPKTGFYRVKKEDLHVFSYLDEGDEFKVIRVWTEDIGFCGNCRSRHECECISGDLYDCPDFEEENAE